MPGGAVQTELDNGNGNAPGTETQTAAAAPEAVQAADGSSLPFTGLDVAMIIGAGGVLLLLGFGIRRVSRPTHAV